VLTGFFCDQISTNNTVRLPIYLAYRGGQFLAFIVILLSLIVSMPLNAHLMTKNDN
jgi:hypothetical protein